MDSIITILGMVKIGVIVGGLAISAFGFYDLATHWEDGGSRRTKALQSVLMGAIIAGGVGGVFIAIEAQLNSLPK